MNTIEVTLENNHLIFTGVLTFDTSVKAIDDAKKKMPKKQHVILDLSGVSRSDSSGLAVLTGLMSYAKKNHAHIKIKGIPKKMMDLARVSGVDGMLSLV